MTPLSSNQIYFWKRNSLNIYPWQRSHLNVEFLEYEKKRIKEVGKWYADFQKKKIGQTLDEVYYYVVPFESSSEWKVAVALKGEYDCVGLSALKNCLQIEILMLVPKGITLPKDYSLIRITNIKKDYIYNQKKNEARYVMIATEFQEQDNSFVYIDVPYEKRIISKFIKENLVNDELIANSFQPTISGSPYVVNNKGGISFSAFLKDTSFSKELLTTLKLMQPIEFSDIQFQLPRTLIKGKTSSLSEGFKFHVAERSTPHSNYYSTFVSNDYKVLNNELVKRNTFKGEYSIVCSLTPRGDDPSELLRDVLSKFVKTEIMHPHSTDELKYSDVDLLKTQKNIDENLWLQIVNQKQMNPLVDSTSTEIRDLRKKLIGEWQIILESMGLKKNIEPEAKVYASSSLSNILRVAQSMARDIQLKKLNEQVISKSFNLFIQNTEGLLNNSEIKRQVKIVIPEKYESLKFNAIRAELSVNILTITDLFSNVKEYFRDIYELQKYIDKFLLEGFLYEPKRGFYQWI